MGKNIAAVAVLLVNSVMKVPSRQMQAKAYIGLVPHTERMPSASRLAIPVYSMALPRLIEPANTISRPQSMLLRAWSMEQQRQIIMAKAARKLACSNGMTFS